MPYLISAAAASGRQATHADARRAGKLKEREVWLNEYETLDDARRGIGSYVERYHQRPHSGLNYRTPLEVRETWDDLQKAAA